MTCVPVAIIIVFYSAGCILGPQLKYCCPKLQIRINLLPVIASNSGVSYRERGRRSRSRLRRRSRSRGGRNRRRRSRSRDKEDKFKGSLSEGMKIEQESSDEKYEQFYK